MRYHTMFHMTNDSHQFRTAAQLDDKGFYRVEGSRWKKGEDMYLPLYEGQAWCRQFDHRANSVLSSESRQRTLNPYLSSTDERRSLAEHANPKVGYRNRSSGFRLRPIAGGRSQRVASTILAIQRNQLAPTYVRGPFIAALVSNGMDSAT